MPDVAEALPDWAEEIETPFDKIRVSVDAEGAYQAQQDAYQEYYSENPPAEGEPYEDAVERLLDGEITQYWLEVFYQSIKLDLQRELKTLNLEILIQDSDKKFSQEDAPEGRGADLAAGGLGGATEARDHYKNVHMVVPGS